MFGLGESKNDRDRAMGDNCASGDHFGHLDQEGLDADGARVRMKENAAARALSNSSPIVNRTCSCF